MTLTALKRRYIGDKEFYLRTIRVAVPIMIQNGITNFVGLLDNIMVGQVGTDPMSGVSIVNQLMFIYNLCVFGGLAGIGIFSAQFYGKGDEKGMRYTFRLKLLLSVLLTVAALGIFLTRGSDLIGLFLHEDGGGGNVDATLGYALEYMLVMYAGLWPFSLSQAYSGTLRETGETVVPMRAGIIAVLVNLVGNYILIYGKFGAPALGVVGAAYATVFSRFVELFLVVFWMHRNTARFPFMKGLYKSLYVPGSLLLQVLKKGSPLLINEFLWSAGSTALTQSYSMRGLSVVAAMNIANTISNVANIAFIAMGSAIAILIGQTLGSGDHERARQEATQLTFFSNVLCVVAGLLLLPVAGIFPKIYNTTDTIRSLASDIIRIHAVCMLIYSYTNACYFILRSGGKTLITFLFDACFMWVVAIPIAYSLVHFTDWPIQAIFICVQLSDLIKCVLGGILVHKGVWVNDLTKYGSA